MDVQRASSTSCSSETGQMFIQAATDGRGEHTSEADHSSEKPPRERVERAVAGGPPSGPGPHAPPAIGLNSKFTV